jgi:hypothetical protein
VSADAHSVANTRRCHVWMRIVASAVAAVIVAGALWYGFGRSPSLSESQTIADCSRSIANVESPTESLTPRVFGSASSVAIAVFDTSRGWRWCFDGMGIGTGPIHRSELLQPVDAPVAVLDGGFGHDALMLVHHNPQTKTVVVETASSPSVVLARGGEFEVLLVPISEWTDWHRPWNRTPVNLGEILGFTSDGHVTASMQFTWCPGSIDVYPGSHC